MGLEKKDWCQHKKVCCCETSTIFSLSIGLVQLLVSLDLLFSSHCTKMHLVSIQQSHFLNIIIISLSKLTNCKSSQIMHTKTLWLLSIKSVINSQLSRCSTARGSSSGFSQVSPTKVEARKSFLFSKSSPVLKKRILT